ncbi:MAG: hypothetical protein LC659_07490 [Myxococcales bacterium]|nr:hypothetical protein [Myxococcales bacterium]
MQSHNKLTLPGFVCAHTHLYSSLARGMPAPAQPPRRSACVASSATR